MLNEYKYLGHKIMRVLKLTKVTLCIVVWLTFSIQAQTNSLSEFTITFDRSNGYNSAVFLRGNNIDVSGSYSRGYAPYVCFPCSQNDTIRFGGASGINTREIANASGYINGVFYPQLYFEGTLFYSSQQNSRIPRVWSKRVRVSAPVTLTGRVGIWQKPQDIGNRSNVLFEQNNVALSGTARLVLSWITDPNFRSRLFTDQYLNLIFASSEQSSNQ
jgi:hypothetical protein